ncbi:MULTISPECIES: hypothetical protein [unclassified Deinococcus]|uniref:hypothetical protein n=1 Tax=unclassified Deinococcus TaxID=2623546 RepID=UPI001C30C3E4|nr:MULTISPECIES: hypothetical protein [unclassified Deinococcus]MDK2013520.1 hypothetical protein [Deinococcus sp. 43]
MTTLPFRTSWGEVRFVPAAHDGLPRVERLRRLHALAVRSEFSALPCSEERRVRAERADRIARALRAEGRA